MQRMPPMKGFSKLSFRTPRKNAETKSKGGIWGAALIMCVLIAIGLCALAYSHHRAVWRLGWLPAPQPFLTLALRE